LGIFAVYQSPWLTIGTLLGFGVIFGIAPLSLAWLWARLVAPRKGGPVKEATYECGLESSGDAWVQFHSSYYIYGIVFLIFDVETLFLLPFAVAFTGLSAGVCLAMLIFLLLLLEGLVWACGKGVLQWA
jgi:NADH:ubiquinone oxidoreductase subunit 3 (subunit A)